MLLIDFAGILLIIVRVPLFYQWISPLFFNAAIIINPFVRTAGIQKRAGVASAFLTYYIAVLCL
jgi:hypothetical protein